MKRVLALGFFDGVHLGHQSLLSQVRQIAAETGFEPTAVSFDPPPAQILTGQVVPLINSVDDRSFMLTSWYGMKQVKLLHATKALLETDWVSYVEEYLLRDLEAQHIVAGYDHRFGYRGEGTAEKLQALCMERGIGCTIVPPVEQDGAAISSTRIRAALEKDPQQAFRLLGHPHLLSGTVSHGRSIGRTMGYPTVNLPLQPNVVLPACGVYASQIEADNRRYLAVTNIGRRPTFQDDDSISVESFLLDFQGDLYGKSLRLLLHRFLRPERKFDTPEALASEIRRNVDQTRGFFSEEDCG